MVICLGRDADLHMPSSCHCHSLSLAPVNADWFYLPGFTFLVLVHPGSPGHNTGGRKIVVKSGCLWITKINKGKTDRYSKCHLIKDWSTIQMMVMLCLMGSQSPQKS